MLGLRLWLCRKGAVSVIKCTDGTLPPFFSEKMGLIWAITSAAPRGIIKRRGYILK
ncbi:MAG: hypothetical protein ACI9FZ_000738 [Bacteroidia bacterium]|jgi:hypothetical protein